MQWDVYIEYYICIIYVYSYVYIYIHVCMYVYIYIHICIYMHCFISYNFDAILMHVTKNLVTLLYLHIGTPKA
jgi:hypothetical protein